MSRELWIAEHERIGEEFASGEIDEPEARARLKALGFDPDEIEEQIAEIKADTGL